MKDAFFTKLFVHILLYITPIMDAIQVFIKTKTLFLT